MAITNFIPEVWSAAILEALRAKLVFPSLCNRDYEGDIREAGDTVHITGYDDVTVRKYVRGQAITVDDANDKEAAVLEIDQSDYFAFKVNDLDKAQAKADMTGKFTNSAAYNMMKNVENYISNLMDTAVSTPAKTVAVGTPADAYLAVVEAGRKLDVQNVPDEGRWLVVSPDFYALLLQAPASSKAPKQVIIRCSTAWSARCAASPSLSPTTCRTSPPARTRSPFSPALTPP